MAERKHAYTFCARWLEVEEGNPLNINATARAMAQDEADMHALRQLHMRNGALAAAGAAASAGIDMDMPALPVSAQKKRGSPSEKGDEEPSMEDDSVVACYDSDSSSDSEGFRLPQMVTDGERSSAENAGDAAVDEAGDEAVDEAVDEAGDEAVDAALVVRSMPVHVCPPLPTTTGPPSSDPAMQRAAEADKQEAMRAEEEAKAAAAAAAEVEAKKAAKAEARAVRAAAVTAETRARNPKRKRHSPPVHACRPPQTASATH